MDLSDAASGTVEDIQLQCWLASQRIADEFIIRQWRIVELFGVKSRLEIHQITGKEMAETYRANGWKACEKIKIRHQTSFVGWRFFYHLNVVTRS